MKPRLLPILFGISLMGCEPPTKCGAEEDGGGCEPSASEPSTDTGLEPGSFKAPLVRLKRVADDGGADGGAIPQFEDEIHVEEVRYRPSDGLLFYCGYTFGVIDATDPADAHYLAQGFGWDLDPNAVLPTGCGHLDWDDDDPNLVYAAHRGNADFVPHLSVVDLHIQPDPDDPSAVLVDPALGVSLQEPGVSYGGLDAENGNVYVALHTGGIGVYALQREEKQLERIGGGVADLVPAAYDVEVVGDLAYVLDEQAGLFVLDVADPNAITEVGRAFLGGLARDIRVDGNHAYVAAGEAGLIVVDVADPANPRVVSRTPTHGTAVRVGYDADRVSVAAWNDTRVYDVSDRANPAIIGAARLDRPVSSDDPDVELPNVTSRALGTDLHGDTLFVGDWRTPYTFAIHAEREAPYLVLPESVAQMGLGPVEVGGTATYELVAENHGTADLTIHEVWADHPGFAVTPSEVRIPPGGAATFTVRYTAETEDEVHTLVHFRSDDPSWPERLGYAVANLEGVGIGDPFPYTEGTDLETFDTWSTLELDGQVALIAYFATYCPVCSIELPDLQLRFHERYGPEGLAVVALDPDTEDHLRPDAVATYVEHLGVTYPVALESFMITPTYETLRTLYAGKSPFPVDVVVDRDGIIRYIAREYDADALEEAIAELLAE